MTVNLLDCTLRDGAYIVDSKFGAPAMKGIIKHMQDANVELVECGWLKDKGHVDGTSFFHFPSDLLNYIKEKKSNTTYVAMIDWDRYNLDFLPQNDGKSIDAIRVVFPRGKHEPSIEIGEKIKSKGYKVYFQAANTLAYSDEELVELALCMNKTKPECVSVVDTFGAMFDEDLERIVLILNKHLDKNIRLGFHSHNNQQLSFSLSIKFVELCEKLNRDCIVDSSLCGMGRGAGNTTTELMSSFLNRKYHKNYDLNLILDAIDIYMGNFQANFSWGYSTPYFIAGMYCTHVNNIAYLLNNHRTNAKDMRNIIESLTPSDRLKYDYDVLEKKYLENQGRQIDDEKVLDTLKQLFKNRKILLVAPGKSVIENRIKIKEKITKENPIVIGVNAFCDGYDYEYMFFVNSARYEYAKEVNFEKFKNTKKILLSNVKADADSDEMIINFNNSIKRGWPHFDNAVICALRLFSKLQVQDVLLAGFDGFKKVYNESYADSSLPSLNPENKWDELNMEITEMFADFKKSNPQMNVEFVTESLFNK